MTETDIHQRENNSDTESFLQENIEDFKRDIDFVYMLMKKGERLTAKTLVQKYGKEPRRLRDLQIAGRCEKAWKLDEKGKRLYVEYFIYTPTPPSKTEVIQRAEKTIELLKSTGTPLTLFT